MPQASEWPTLREELARHRIDASPLDDADRRITSFAVKADASWFAIAYYWYQGNDILPPELRIRTLDRETGTWRSAMIHAANRRGGSAVGIDRSKGWIFLDLHISPSAGELIVLSSDFKVRRRLDGWSSLILADGRVVYENSMVHFAPYHPGAATLYDPSTNQEFKLYPSGPIQPAVEAPQDRSIARIEQAGPQRIAIWVTEQDLRWRDNVRTEPNGPERKLTVSCDLSGPKPRCIAEPARSTKQRGARSEQRQRLFTLAATRRPDRPASRVAPGSTLRATRRSASVRPKR